MKYKTYSFKDFSVGFHNMKQSVRVYSILVVVLLQVMGQSVKAQIQELKQAVGVVVNMENLIFRYFNRMYRNSSFLINITDASFSGDLSRLWNYQEDLKVITHGWSSSEASRSVAEVREAYLDVASYNVITLDWSYTAGTMIYPVPAVMTYQVGVLAARVLDTLVELRFTDYNRVHMIGHSLGAHVAGATSAHCKERLARVTGLDPAGPGFQYILSTDMRLDETDAHFVDVIHTAGGTAGYYTVLGHADFYPNGGTPVQPGCVELSLNVISTVAGALDIGCSHMRSYLFFIESIRNPRAFRSRQCGSWAHFQSGQCGPDIQYMGEPCSPQARGVYYLFTNAQSPYSTEGLVRNMNFRNTLSNLILF